MNQLAARGKVTRFQQFGTVSVLFCGAIGTFLIVSTIRSGNIGQTVFVTTIATALTALLATLTIEVDDLGVRWFFTGGFFGSSVTFAEIATMTTRKVFPLGLGYRVANGRRAWLVTGRNVFVLQLTGGKMQYYIGADDPEAVRQEVERRWKR